MIINLILNLIEKFSNLVNFESLTLTYNTTTTNLNLIKSHPKLNLRNNPSKEINFIEILKGCSEYFNLKLFYYPTIWLRNGHLQTIRYGLLNQILPIDFYTEELIELEDGEKLALDWSSTPSKTSEDPILIILHGLSGCSNEEYILTTIRNLKACTKLNYHCVVINNRGCGRLPITKPLTFSGGYTKDLNFVINAIKDRYPNSPLYGAGFSLGANILTKYLGEQSNRTPLSGAISVANPFNLHECQEAMRKTFIGKYIYIPAMLKGLTNVYLRNKKQLQVYEPKPDTWKTVADFDADLVVKIHKHANVMDYYTTASSYQFIDKIAIPTLFIHCLDDPISVKECIPYTEIESNPNCLLVTTPTGGHLGQYEGLFQPKQLFTFLIKDYLDTLTLAYKSIENNLN